MINVNGEYYFKVHLQSMFLNEILEIKRTNLITFRGEAFFMNRWLNEEFEPIKYICLGKGTANPRKSDEKLYNISHLGEIFHLFTKTFLERAYLLDRWILRL